MLLVNNAKSYKEIYRICCKEENMSVVHTNIHPDLILRGPMPWEIAARHELSREKTKRERMVGKATGAILCPQRYLRVVPVRGLLEWASRFPFDRLPPSAQARIFSLLLYKHGALVHALSRLD